MRRKIRTKKPNRHKTKLGLPDLEHVKSAVLVSLRSPESQRSYRRSIEDFVSWCNEPLRTIIILATMTGLRIGEILALRWGRIDLLRGTLRVAETCYKGHFGSPKTRASRREVPLAAAVVRELKSLYSRSTEKSERKKNVYIPNQVNSTSHPTNLIAFIFP